MTRIITTSVAGAGKTPQYSAVISGYGTSVSETVLDRDLTPMVQISTEKWSDYINVDFVPISDSGSNDVAGANGDWHLRFIVAPQSSLTAYGTAFGYSGPLGKDAVIYINSLIVLPSYNVTNDPGLFQSLVMHEMGHVIGLSHTGDTSSIMYTGSAGPFANITPLPAEIATVQSNFGAPETRTDKLTHGALIGDVWSMYRGIYGADPDIASFKFWNNAILDGLQSRESFSNAMAAAVGGSDATFVGNLYTGALGRSGSPAEMSYWAGQIPSFGRGYVARAIAFSSEAATYRYNQMYTGLWYE